MSRRLADILGFGSITAGDLTGEKSAPPAFDRRNNSARIETLDRFNGGAHIYGDEDIPDFAPDEEDDILPEEVSDAAQHANSQLDPTEECPSTTGVGRLVWQNQNKGD